MIRRSDFEIEIGRNDRGAFVRVKHTPTGNERIQESVSSDRIGRVREVMIAELRGLLFGPHEVEFRTGRSEGGDYISVRHLPTGIERSAMRRESNHELLLDALLEEIYSGRPSGDSA